MADRDAVELIRSEEQLHVRTVSVPRSRLRVRKVIVTEERTVTVTVRREELRVDEEPVPEAGPDERPDDERRAERRDDGQWAEGDLTLVLHEEEVVVTKRIVPVERVRVVKRRVTVDTPVTDSVRRERVDAPGDARVEPTEASGPSTAGGSNESGVASPRRPEDLRP